uniref:leucine--tRNA ligase n=1 Tax=Oncorhynchus tshawytscha TaxID=74940 RepID=A0AAZ3QN52_ONCTS
MEDTHCSTLLSSQASAGRRRLTPLPRRPERKVGGHLTSTKLRDWLISRQRYWGTPIPMVHCGSCGPVAAPEEQLPITLPKLLSLTGKGASPLKHTDDWISCTCPRCKGPDGRPTPWTCFWTHPGTISDTDPHNQDSPGLLSAPSQTTGFLWTCTLGGKDHAVIHLYYARFLSHFCRDPGLVGHRIFFLNSREPFKKLLVQGLNKGQTFRAADRGQYPKRDHMDFTGPGRVVQTQDN